MKQYTISDAYTDNYSVDTYNDGILESRDIFSYYEISGYTSCLESQGYSRAYKVEEYKSKFEKAIEQFEIAKEEYEKSLKNSLIIK